MFFSFFTATHVLILQFSMLHHSFEHISYSSPQYVIFSHLNTNSSIQYFALFIRTHFLFFTSIHFLYSSEYKSHSSIQYIFIFHSYSSPRNASIYYYTIFSVLQNFSKLCIQPHAHHRNALFSIHKVDFLIFVSLFREPIFADYSRQFLCRVVGCHGQITAYVAVV
jgi:hypothetical protein